MPYKEQSASSDVFDFAASPYKAVQGTAADAQRRAMHIAARGFHGLGDINARGTARIGVKVVAPKLPPTTRFIKTAVTRFATSHNEAGFAIYARAAVFMFPVFLKGEF